MTPSLKKMSWRKKGILSLAATGFLYAAELNNGYVEHTIGAHLSQRQSSAIASGETSFTAFGMDFPFLDEHLETITAEISQENDITVKDRKGNILAEQLQLERYTSLDEISDGVVWTVIAAEDIRFYQHHGIDHGSTASAGWRNLKRSEGKRMRGASTLSIQLADMLLENKPTWKETKKYEWSYALLIETEKKKPEILEAYLNTAVFGHSRREKKDIKGIRAAAKYYFNKEPIQINLTEAAVLASMINHPTVYGTRMYDDVVFKGTDQGESRSFQRMLERAAYIVEGLKTVRVIYGGKTVPEEEIIRAEREIRYGKISLHKNGKYAIAKDVYEYIDETLDVVVEKAEINHIERASIDVTVGIDRDLQQFARDVFVKHRERVREKAAVYSSFAHPELISGSVVVLDIKTDAVLALIGGAGVANGDYLNRATLQYLNPGSTAKPFILAMALERGYSLETTFVDEKKTYEIKNGRDIDLYTPENYGGFTNVPWTLHDALVESINSVYIALGDALLTYAGEEALRDDMHQLGFPLEYFHLSSAIGTFPASLLDIAGAYATLAKQCKPAAHEAGGLNHAFAVQMTADGRDIPLLSEQYDPSCSEFTAWQVDEALEDVVAENFSWNADEHEGYTLRGKTGTAAYNIVFVAYQPEIGTLVAVSFASDNPSLTGKLPKKITAAQYAAPAAFEIMEYLVDHHEKDK